MEHMQGFLQADCSKILQKTIWLWKSQRVVFKTIFWTAVLAQSWYIAFFATFASSFKKDHFYGIFDTIQLDGCNNDVRLEIIVMMFHIG